MRLVVETFSLRAWCDGDRVVANKRHGKLLGDHGCAKKHGVVGTRAPPLIEGKLIDGLARVVNGSS